MQTFNSPLEAFNYWVKNTPDNIYLRQPINGKFIEYSYRKADEEIRRMASAIKKLNLGPNPHIALLSKNCAHWLMADLAIMMAGGVSIPIYPTLDPDSISQILTHSESKAIFIGKLDNYESQKPGIKGIIKIGVELYGIHEDHCWDKLIKKNEPLKDIHIQKPEDLLTIMYTSGTTGAPKGVMHKVSSFNEVANTFIKAYPLPDFGRFFSYLPLSHIAERIGIEIVSMYKGGVVSFAESLDTFAQDLESVQPQLFFGVPRIWQKFKEKILLKLPQKKMDLLLKIPIVSGIIKKKLRYKLGLSDSLVFAGAAPIAIDLLEWFNRLGIEINQAYGMTEDSISSHFNFPGRNKFGTVGKPLPGVETKLSPEGEVLIKNKSLTIGYYKEKEKTAEIFTEDGFLKTGDIGEYDHDGYLTITGRIKDQFKTDKGKYISPAPIELELLKNTDIDQVCVVGTGIAQPIALIIPSESGKQKAKDELSKSLSTTLIEVNNKLQAYEKIEKAVIMKEDWSVDNGLLTPTLKVKRNRVEAIHTPMYQSWFSQADKVIFES
ncbi:MAG TPA: AMP-binding protein [Anditalea sp.]|nr:AMP-binding protein [Anditalea sp.]